MSQEEIKALLCLLESENTSSRLLFRAQKINNTISIAKEFISKGEPKEAVKLLEGVLGSDDND